MANIVVGGIVAVIIGAAISYIVRAKKRGAVCIGCSNGGGCASKHGGSCNCHGTDKEK